MKRIYARKLDVLKIRIHGNFYLRKVLMTGKDVAIVDFSGDTRRSYSERRLKRSPLRDVASMLSSIYDVAYEAFLANRQIHPDEMQSLVPFIIMWTHYMTGFFMHAYLQSIEGSGFVPNDKKDMAVMIQTFMLESAVADLVEELNNRPDWVRIPLRVIQNILEQQEYETT